MGILHSRFVRPVLGRKAFALTGNCFFRRCLVHNFFIAELISLALCPNETSVTEPRPDGRVFSLSSTNIYIATPTCLRLEMQLTRTAFLFALPRAGYNLAASMAMP